MIRMIQLALYNCTNYVKLNILIISYNILILYSSSLIILKVIHNMGIWGLLKRDKSHSYIIYA